MKSLHSIRRWIAGYGLFVSLLLLWATSTIGSYWLDGLLAWTAGLIYVAYDSWLIGYVAWSTRHLGRQKASPALLAAAPTLSVIVPARNEASVLAATLDALLAQRDAPDEILLVDDGSTDNTASLLRQHYGVEASGHRLVASTLHPRLRVLFKSNSGKAASMNAALPLLQSEIVITLDADTRLHAGALAAFRQAFAAQPALIAACGVLTPRCAGGWAARLFETFQTFEYLRAFLSRAAWMHAGALLLVSGAFAGYRRKALLAVGGFDTYSLVEDYEITHRLHRHAFEQGLDWRIEVASQAHAETDAPASLSTFLQQRRRWFAGFLQTQYRYRALHGNPRYGKVGTLMLPVKSVDTLQPVYGLTAFALLLSFLISDAPIALAVLAVIGIKLLVDFSYHLWAVHLYHRWLADPLPAGIWWKAAAATLAEPFSFQLLRHFGAAWGWWQTLRGQRDWAPQRPASKPLL